MWILLKIKTDNRDVTGIEKIAKTYCYVMSVPLETWKLCQLQRIAFQSITLF